MIRCKNCNSINVKVSDMNFARTKRSGESSAKAGLPKKQFHCLDCKTTWGSDSEAYKLYFEYGDLRPRTTMVAQTMKPGGTYTAVYIKPEELMRRHELAKILFDKYRSCLDLGAEEWYDIELDSRH